MRSIQVPREIEMENQDHRKSEIWKGVVAGAIGGLVASWAMNQFQAAWSAASDRLKHQDEPALKKRRAAREEQSEDATMKAAGRLFLVVSHRELSREQKKKAGPIMHYAFGTSMGALYGGLTEIFPAVAAGRGSVFASALFLGADEIAVPAFGLSSGESAPASTHLYAWVSHVVYGFTLDVVSSRVRGILDVSDVEDVIPFRRAA